MKHKYRYLQTIIFVGLLAMPLLSSAVSLEQSSSTANQAISETHKLTTLGSGQHESEDVAEETKLDSSSSNDPKIIPEIQWLTKIVSELLSNDKEMKTEMAQLTGRVSRLESSTPFEEEHSTGSKRRNKRQLTKTATSVRPCSNKACAFDYGKENWVQPTIPTRCKDLLEMGHVLNGFYPILTEGKIQLVFCNFNAPKVQGMQTQVGFVDIKSSPTYFFLQTANDRFSVHNVPMPFEITKLNVGNAMNGSTGIFTAPKAGIYYFAYSGIKDWDSGSTALYLQLNGNNEAIAHATGITGGLTMALHATLKLQAGDKISLVLTQGVIHNFYTNYTNFVGWLLEEHDFSV